MANIVAVEANNQLQASLALATYTATTAPVKLRLMTANGSASAAGTEVTGGSYAAGGLSLTAALGTATGGSVTTTSAINYTSMPATTVVGIEIWDSAGTPVRKWFGSITSKTTNAGDTLSFAASSVVIGTS
jgi:hypothetical protein